MKENQKEFSVILKEIEKYDAEREELIKKSRDVLKLSKQIIYGLHRGENVSKLVVEIKKEVEVMKKTKMTTEGSYKIALQEYVEAISFKKFIEEKKLLTLKESNVDSNEYLLGIMDLSGEIFRFAMNNAIKGDYKIASESLDFMNFLYGELLKFNFRNSEFRRKFDSIKYDLQKLEKLVFDLKIKN